MTNLEAQALHKKVSLYASLLPLNEQNSRSRAVCVLAIQRTYRFSSFTQNRTCLISHKTAVTNASPAETKDIRLLPLIDQHTGTHFWQLPINPPDVEPVR